MHATDVDARDAILGAALEVALPYGISEPSASTGNPPDAPTPLSADRSAHRSQTRIEIFRPMDRDALVISAGDHSVCVPMRAIRERLRAEGAIRPDVIS
jgi:hypothetical protein